MFCIIMGVSGTGKTTIGKLLGQQMGWDFYDGDDFHPEANILKMQQGIPLTDSDRLPWLINLRQLVKTSLQQKRNGILACSALKVNYRRLLGVKHPEVQLIYLKGEFDAIWSRMCLRQNHFMPASLLQSQFDILEEPSDAWSILATQPSAEIVATIIQQIKNTSS